MTRPVTRRHLLGMIGAAGGASAVYQASMAMGLMPESTPVAQLDLKPATSNTSAVVLGAGLAGLAVACELEQAGYDVTVIEASHRAGGRNFTVRSGDIIDELGNRQVCKFDDHPDLFFNAGPARIPGHHRRTLRYCRDLGVPLIVKANFARNAYHHDENHFGGKPVRMGHYVADARGFLSELLFKAIDKNQFEQPFSSEDRERLMQFATSFGDLAEDGQYKGSRRAGYENGYMNPEVYRPPLSFDEILDSDFWRFAFFLSENPDWGEPLMEVPGGMDRIVGALVRKLSKPVTMNAPVQSIDLSTDGVDIVYLQNGERVKISADYCFNSIPIHFMPGIPNNLPEDYRRGMAALRPGNFMKIGFQMRSRFWEDEGIYGGSTFTMQPINTIWYPSHDIHGKKGVVLGAYAIRERSKPWERMSPADRLKLAAECGDKIHDGYSSYIESGISVPWGRMNHMMGCSINWTDEQHDQYFELLRRPAAGRHYLIGDQMSYHPTWQEGAFASAEYALLDFDKRMRDASTRTGLG